jgi:hypothetical protein
MGKFCRSNSFERQKMTATFQEMKAIRVHVENGQITGDAPPGMPEGDVDLVLADEDDGMSEAEMARLNDALERGFESIKAGRFRSARDAVADLRHRFR